MLLPVDRMSDAEWAILGPIRGLDFPSRRVVDQSRNTFAFASPYTLAVFNEWLDTIFSPEAKPLWAYPNSKPMNGRRMRTKNKFKTGKSAVERTNILINFAVDHPVIDGLVIALEIQLTLRDHLEIKKTLHTFYKILRAKLPLEVLRSDLFWSLLANMESKRDTITCRLPCFYVKCTMM